VQLAVGRELHHKSLALGARDGDLPQLAREPLGIAPEREFLRLCDPQLGEKRL
jgi:hypothetical protein